jgi:RimJ/RimL family protein N-acetyltransferase
MKLEAIQLENDRVLLAALSMENFHHLIPIAAQPGLVRYSPSSISTKQDLLQYVEKALLQRVNRESIPFIVYDKSSSCYAGSTRYMNIDWLNKVLHIGATWLGREFHSTGLNTHMKQLMIDHAFYNMHFEKVEFRIDERNIPSRKAVEKLGAVLEGILRENVYLSDGFKRNTCCYGLLPKEWEAFKSGK